MLESGSEQDYTWGVNWYPAKQQVEFEALIDIRPALGNRGIMIQSQYIRSAIGTITRSILSDVQWSTKNGNESVFCMTPYQLGWQGSLLAWLGLHLPRVTQREEKQ